jgi:hypothetical protein
VSGCPDAGQDLGTRAGRSLSCLDLSSACLGSGNGCGGSAGGLGSGRFGASLRGVTVGVTAGGWLGERTRREDPGAEQQNRCQDAHRGAPFRPLQPHLPTWT